MLVVADVSFMSLLITDCCRLYYCILCVRMNIETPVVKVPLDARERSCCTSNYWDPAFLRLKCHNTLRDPQLPVVKLKADVPFPRLWLSTLTTGSSVLNVCLFVWINGKSGELLRDRHTVRQHYGLCLYLCRVRLLTVIQR